MEKVKRKSRYHPLTKEIGKQLNLVGLGDIDRVIRDYIPDGERLKECKEGIKKKWFEGIIADTGLLDHFSKEVLLILGRKERQ